MAKSRTKVAAKRSNTAAQKKSRRPAPTRGMKASSPPASRTKTAPPRAAKPAPRRKQRFTVSHLDETEFKTQGLRRYAQYRDLGIAEATGGMVQAHVIRFVPPCRPEEVSKLHTHDVDFQMIYVLKGSMTSEFEGQGAVTMRQGTAWIQPPRIRHKVLDYSDDCEVLEIVLPADFKTEELE
jgi:mannose-6-phosphate isomerase-like protein (cupin superfamily)